MIKKRAIYSYSPPLGIQVISGVNDIREVSFQAGTSNQTAIDIRHCKQFFCIAGIDGSAILNTDLFRCFSSVDLAKNFTDRSTDFLSLFICCGLTGTDSPDRLIGDNCFNSIFRFNIFQRDLCLQTNKIFSDSLFSLLQCFTNTDNGFQAMLQCFEDLLIDDFIGLTKITASF